MTLHIFYVENEKWKCSSFCSYLRNGRFLDCLHASTASSWIHPWYPCISFTKPVKIQPSHRILCSDTRHHCSAVRSLCVTCSFPRCVSALPLPVVTFHVTWFSVRPYFFSEIRNLPSHSSFFPLPPARRANARLLRLPSPPLIPLLGRPTREDRWGHGRSARGLRL